MKKIEERAELNLQYERDFCGYNLSDNMVKRAYRKGATEQKAIDIEIAVAWLRKYVRPYYKFSIEDFKKAMEEE